jgi:hypothetical protein
MIASSIHQYNDNMEANKLLIPMPQLTKVLSLLVNSSVTEINCSAFGKKSDEMSRKFNHFLLKHTLKNCPKINKVKLLSKKPFFHLLGKLEILPVELFKKSWNDVKSIKSHTEYLCTDDTLKFIQENFPNIE